MRTFPALPRKRSLLWIVPLLVCTWSCAGGSATPDREWVRPAYEERIKDWQMRIQREGWSESRVNSVLARFRDLVAFRVDMQDHWDTPKEFTKKGFSGDCEDIATFMMATLKRLGYPHGVHILVVRSMLDDHALLKVELPDGGWRVFDVVPARVARVTNTGLLKPVVEFDEQSVKWYAPPDTPALVARATGTGPAAEVRKGTAGERIEEASLRLEPGR